MYVRVYLFIYLCMYLCIYLLCIYVFMYKVCRAWDSSWGSRALVSGHWGAFLNVGLA